MEITVEGNEKAKDVSGMTDAEVIEEMVRLRKRLVTLREVVVVNEERLISLGKEKTRREVERFEAAGKVEKVDVDARVLAQGEKWKRC